MQEIYCTDIVLSVRSLVEQEIYCTDIVLSVRSLVDYPYKLLLHKYIALDAVIRLVCR